MQWGIRLLVTWESRLLELAGHSRRWSARSIAKTLTYPWTHPDPRVDVLQQQVMALAGVRLTRSREERLRCARIGYAARGASSHHGLRSHLAFAIGDSVYERALVLLS